MMKSPFKKLPLFFCLLFIMTAADLNAQQTVLIEKFSSLGAPQNAAITKTSNSASEINAFSLRVNPEVVLTIGAGSSITIQNDIINNGSIIVESDGNLIQINDEGKYIIDVPLTTPSPLFTVKREANIKRLDYVYWSSPVTGQNLKTFSPRTVASRFLTYNEWDDKFTAVPNIATTDFSVAIGYAIRADNNYPVWTGTAPTSAYRDFVGVFAGIPNTGIITFPLKYQSGTIIPGSGNGHNLVGNPYPSNIRLNGTKGLFTQNTSVIAETAYFWTNVNPNVPEGGATYSGDNYAIFNDSGGKAAANSLQIPSEIVKVGQGFIVKATGKNQNLVFNNAMRNTGASEFFDRKIDQPKDRFWLRLTTPNQNFTTLLIAYVPNATNGFEYSYDAPLIGMSSDALFSILDDYQLGIQGKQYPLNPTDVVSLGTNSYVSGDHVISLQEKEGIFANGQNIYLKDKQTNKVTNLSAGAYTFTANAGLTKGRFEIIYENDIVLGTGTTNKDELIVYRDGTDFVVKAATKKISDIEVYDTSGRLMVKLKPNQTEVRIAGQALINTVYVLKINQNGKITTRKIIR